MRLIKRAMVLLLICTALLIKPSYTSFAKQRDIYVGDLISLEITNLIITENDLRAKFADFEIVDLVVKDDKYIITIRCFEAGTKKIMLGSDELVITIKSTLDAISRENFYDGSLEHKPVSLYIPWVYILLGIFLLFLVSLVITLIGFINNKKERALTPFERFVRQLDQIQFGKKECFAQMTQLVKRYLDDNYSCNIRGKTSTEIVEELKGIPELRTLLPALENWFITCDRYKYTNVAATEESRQSFANELKELVMTIEKGAKA